LKGLQDLLGELRDVQVLAQEITQGVEEAAAARARRLHRLALDGGVDADRATEERPDEGAGLVELARMARERAAQLFGEVETEWLAGQPESFLVKMDAFGQSLARRRRKHVEIERKFLLTELPERVRSEGASEVSQGWIPGADLQERVRWVRNGRGEEFTRTLKFGTGIRRTEIEEETTRDVFESLWALTAGRRVEKRRYEVPEGDLVWEIDQFTDRDLVLAEVELPTEDSEVRVPGWLKPYVVREVTDEAEYVNLNLAK
jgi:CYTH domain-containing protein